MKKFTLGEIATYINGYAFKPEDWSDTGFEIIRIQNLSGNEYSINRFNGSYDRKYEVNTGDVLISWSASLGVYIWSKDKALLNQHIFKVVFDKEVVNKDYFVFQVRKILLDAEEKTHGATMKHLTKPVFDALPYIVVPMAEQERIALILRKIEKLIDLRKQELNMLNDLIKSRFVEMFGNPVDNPKGYEKFRFKDLCTSIGDGIHGTPVYDDCGTHYFINGNNLQNKKIVITQKTKRISDEVFEKLHIEMDSKTILLSINGSLGNLAFYDDEPVALGKSACYCNIGKQLNREFVAGLFSGTQFQQYMNKVSTGTTIKNFGLKALREFDMIVPPLEEQSAYARLVAQTDKSKLNNWY